MNPNHFVCHLTRTALNLKIVVQEKVRPLDVMTSK